MLKREIGCGETVTRKLQKQERGWAEPVSPGGKGRGFTREGKQKEILGQEKPDPGMLFSQGQQKLQDGKKRVGIKRSLVELRFQAGRP